MRLLRRSPLDQHARTLKRRGRQRGLRAIDVAPQGEAARDHRRRFVLVERARRADNEVGQPVVRVGVLEDVVAGQSRDRLFGPGDVAAQRMVRPDQLLEEVLDVVLRLVLVHAKLFENHHPFAFDVCRIEPGVGDDIGEDVEAQRHVLGRNPRPVGGQLFVRRRIDETAYALDRVRDLLWRRTPPGALEEEVLDEVRGACEALVFKPRTAAEHENDARRVALRHRLRNQARPSWQRVDPMRGAHWEAKV